jgi:hypothetical protein
LLPERERIDFQAEALATIAASDPTAAVTIALGLGEIESRNTAIQRVGIAWVARDPSAAVAQTNLLPVAMQAAYLNRVTTEWARLDVDAFLDYADAQPRLDNLVAAVTHAMGVDPQRSFEISARHPPVRMGDDYARTQTVEREAFSGWAERDPEGTLVWLDALPVSARKQDLMVAFAETYGRTDPESALAWAQGIVPADQTLVSAVIARASLTDMDLALRWLIEFEPASPGGIARPGSAADNIGIFFGADPRRVSLANRLLDMQQEPNAGAALQRLMRV